jgi:hypothetical protein
VDVWAGPTAGVAGARMPGAVPGVMTLSAMVMVAETSPLAVKPAVAWAPPGPEVLVMRPAAG